VTTPFERALRDELAAAAAREQARAWPRRWRRIAVGVAAAVAAVLAAFAIGTSGPATADVEVTHHGDRVEVVLTDPVVDPGELVRAVRRAGFAAELQRVPTGPSSVGHYLGSYGDDDVEDLQGRADDGTVRTGFSLPAGWKGRLLVREGRPARAGEAYVGSTDAFAHGEPLECTGARGRPVRDLVGLVHDLVVRVQVVSPGATGAQLTLADAAASDVGSWPVVSAAAVSAEEVVVRVEPPAMPVTADPGC
jgi:hypothetical protein